MSIKTLVELDLVGYSDVCRALEENLGAHVVAQFNSQIQEFVNTGLKAVHAARAQVVLATTGDGAILAFDRAVDSHHFAVAVHHATQAHNATRSTASSQRWFRIGAASGELFQQDGIDGKEIAGTVIANAVRLETAAKPGQIVMDAATFALLPADIQGLYGEEEIVAGKRGERFPARRCSVIVHKNLEDSPPSPQGILDLFDRLNPRDQLERVMLLIGMPHQFRPANVLQLFRRQEGILDWAVDAGDATMKKLEKTLNDLVQKQQPMNI
ncbi:MAG: hypothetical protein ACJ71W_14680 [Terriglobales bacterium]